MSRHAGEVIHIGNARIVVLAIGRNSVKLGVEAPREVPVARGELLDVHEQLQRHYRQLFGPGEGEQSP